jgi:hypothetical protein
MEAKSFSPEQKLVRELASVFAQKERVIADKHKLEERIEELKQENAVLIGAGSASEESQMVASLRADLNQAKAALEQAQRDAHEHYVQSMGLLRQQATLAQSEEEQQCSEPASASIRETYAQKEALKIEVEELQGLLEASQRKERTTAGPELAEMTAAIEAKHAAATGQALDAKNAEHASILKELVATKEAEHAAVLKEALAAKETEHMMALEKAIAANDAEHKAALEQALASKDAHHALAMMQALEAKEAQHQESQGEVVEVGMKKPDMQDEADDVQEEADDVQEERSEDKLNHSAAEAGRGGAAAATLVLSMDEKIAAAMAKSAPSVAAPAVVEEASVEEVSPSTSIDAASGTPDKPTDQHALVSALAPAPVLSMDERIAMAMAKAVPAAHTATAPSPASTQSALDARIAAAMAKAGLGD